MSSSSHVTLSQAPGRQHCSNSAEVISQKILAVALFFRIAALVVTWSSTRLMCTAPLNAKPFKETLVTSTTGSCSVMMSHQLTCASFLTQRQRVAQQWQGHPRQTMAPVKFSQQGHVIQTQLHQQQLQQPQLQQPQLQQPQLQQSQLQQHVMQHQFQLRAL